MPKFHIPSANDIVARIAGDNLTVEQLDKRIRINRMVQTGLKVALVTCGVVAAVGTAVVVAANEETKDQNN